MARPQRTIAPGLWHHVTHRGVVGAAIFPSPDDRAEFLDILAHCDARFGLRTQAASLLDTSYQLLVFDASGQLGRAMRHLNGVYTQALNRRHGSVAVTLRATGPTTLRWDGHPVTDGQLTPLERGVHDLDVSAAPGTVLQELQLSVDPRSSP